MLKIKIENENDLYKNLEFEFNKGLTCLIGKNGAGKSTLLRILKSYFKEKEIKVFYYDNEEQEKHAMEKFTFYGQMDLVARNFASSEGQNIRNNFEDFVPKLGDFIRKLIKDKKDKAIILLDGLDSGISLDYVLTLKKDLFSLIMKDCEKNNLECYIIIAANNYEFCNNEDCIYVTTGKHYKFKDYNAFREIYLTKEDKSNE